MGTQRTLSVRRHSIRETIIPHRLKVVWLSLADEDEEIRVVKVHKLKSELASHLNVDIIEVFYTQTVTPNKGVIRYPQVESIIYLLKHPPYLYVRGINQ